MGRFYIATRLENHEAHRRHAAVLRERGHEITYDWTEHGAVWRHGIKRVRDVAQLECAGVREADGVLVLMPGGRGTHVELGLACALELPVVLVAPGREIDCSSDTCAFYHLPNVLALRAEVTTPAETVETLVEWARHWSEQHRSRE